MKPRLFIPLRIWFWLCGLLLPFLIAADAKAPPYVVIAGGACNLISNAPGAAPVHLTFRGWEGDPGSTAVFRVANNDTRAVLIWNYRIQVRPAQSGTNSAGWETVQDDYPGAREIATLNAGASDKIFISAPGRTPWRVCILYSRGKVSGESPRQYTGNYEVIGPEIKD